MEFTVYYVVLGIHIVAGHLALIAGLINMIRKKGDRLHQKFGKVFYLAMLFVSASAIYLSITGKMVFLLVVGIFVLYQAVAGWLAVKKRTIKPSILEMLFLMIFLANGVFMVLTGNLILWVFGGITFLLVYSEIKTFYKIYANKPIDPKAWLARHIGMSMGAYIGTITAFLVVNVNNFQPAWLVWLTPTFILVPLITIWTNKFAKPVKKVRSS